MKKANLNKAVYVGISFLLFICTLFVINSCRKEIRLGPLSTKTDSVNFARQWYESTYPAGGSYSARQMASVGGTKEALNNFIKPDWKHAGSYKRFNKDVIELPLNDSTKLGVSPAKTSFSFDKNASKSSFLIINDGQNYTAYIMTILADSSYLQNDYTKLAQNSYSKRDVNFSGFVLYSTPAGNLIKGWHYLNGKVNKAVSPSASPQLPALQVQGLSSAKKMADVGSCYVQEYIIYLGGYCISTGDYSPTCTDYYADYYEQVCDTQSFPPDINTGGVGSSGPGFPDPTGIPTPAILTIKEDSLKKHFPCATKLIIDSLQKIPAYFNLVAPFATTIRPDLVWSDSTMAWSNSNYQFGLTIPQTSGAGQSATISLSTQMLQNSSQLLIAAVAVHETLHAYINYMVMTANYNVSSGISPTGSWLYSLDSWITIYGLPSNYSNHYEMLSNYFDQAVAILASWDNNQHTMAEYQMATLIGLDNATDGDATQRAMLQQLFNAKLSQYNISSTAFNTFKINNITSTINKLPGNCN